IGVNNLPYISKKFFKRNLTYSSIKFSIFSGKLESENVIFSSIDNVELFKIKKIIIIVDSIKTLSFKPTLKYFYIEGLSAYALKDKDAYTLPKYLDLNSKSSGSKINFSIKYIEIKDSVFQLKEGSKFIPLINDINILLPELDASLNLKPKISAKIGDKTINITGNTTIKDDEISVDFNLLLKDFNLKEISFLIPAINYIKIVSGRVDTDLNLIYKSGKNKKQKFDIGGYLAFKNLNLFDVGIKSDFIKNGFGNISLKNWDVFGNVMEIDRFNINSMVLNLSFSKNENENSSVIPKKSNKKSNFTFFNKFLNVDSLYLTINDKINNYQYNIAGNVVLKNFKTNSNEDMDFSISAKTDFVKELNVSGLININNGLFDLKKIELFQFDLNNFLYLKESIKELKKLKINNYFGSGYFSKENNYVSGTISLNEIIYKTKNGDIEIKDSFFDLSKYDMINKILYLNNLEISNMVFPITENDVINNLRFKLLKKESNYIIKLTDSEKKYTIKDKIALE
ncbi:MAG TPA: hypothetical protein PK771_14620, partial [Spirochaetota bacterium]|nr:hypothetical protein [Spirochaetota bacterium]